ncbi:MAG: ABC transporter permease [Leucobacter sp.]
MSRFARSLSAEFRKVTATKIWWILALVLAVYSAMMAATFAALFVAMADALGAEVPALPEQEAANIVYATVTSFGYVIPLLLGSLMATGELRHRILGLAFIAEPKRIVVLLSKTVVLLALGVVIGVVGLIGSVAAGAGVIGLTDSSPMLGTGETWQLFARVIVAMALWAVIGFGIGALVRNQAFAIVLALVFTQFLEPVLRMGAQFWDWSASVARFLPGSATDAFVGASALDMSFAESADSAGPEALGSWQGLLVLVAYGVVTLFAGWILRWRGDVE